MELLRCAAGGDDPDEKAGRKISRFVRAFPAGWSSRRRGEAPSCHPRLAGRAADGWLRDHAAAQRTYSGDVASEPRRDLSGTAAAKNEGLVADEDVDGRRVFSLSEAGRAKADRDFNNASLEEIVKGADPAVLELRDAALQVGAVLTQIARSGKPSQKRRALEILADARRRLYLILVDGE
jgi:hypothetical protein